MQLSSIVGQAQLKTDLRKLVQQERMPHALMLLDSGGRGGLPLAIAATTYLLCEARTDTDACGQCGPCRQMAKLAHPDVHYSYPTMKVKDQKYNLSSYYAEQWKEFLTQTPYGSVQDWLSFINIENKQAIISIDETRQIIESLSLKSFQNGAKVQIIWMPEYFSGEGMVGNTLLKLIEEPPSNTVIILVAANEEQILATIKSRVQLFSLRPIPANDIAVALIERHAVAAVKAEQIGLLAQGSYTQALAVLNHSSDDILPMAREWLRCITANDGVAMLRWAEDTAGHGKEEMKGILGFCQQLLQEGMRQQITGIPGTHAQILAPLIAKQPGVVAYQLMVDTIVSHAYNIQRQSNAKIQLLAMCVALQYNMVGRTLE